MNQRIELLGEPVERALTEQTQHQPGSLVAPQNPQSPMAMMMQAHAQGISPDVLERMWALNVKHEERESGKAFNQAFAEFKSDPPVIVKNKHVSFASAKGQTDYDHATHSEVTKKISKALAAFGLAHSWSSDQSDGKIRVRCTLSHRLGHSISTTMESPYDASGGKNITQSIGSAQRYLERYTLLSITGLTTDDIDDDGRDASAEDAAFALRDEWIERINAALNDNVLTRTWQMALAEIEPLNRMDVYGAVKDAAAAKRKTFKVPS